MGWMIAIIIIGILLFTVLINVFAEIVTSKWYILQVCRDEKPATETRISWGWVDNYQTVQATKKGKYTWATIKILKQNDVKWAAKKLEKWLDKLEETSSYIDDMNKKVKAKQQAIDNIKENLI